MDDELETRRRMSRYRQVRITATLERGGTLSYRVYAKPLNAAWDERACILSGALRGIDPLMSPDDVYAALVQVLLEQTLPGI